MIIMAQVSMCRILVAMSYLMCPLQSGVRACTILDPWIRLEVIVYLMEGHGCSFPLAVKPGDQLDEVWQRVPNLKVYCLTKEALGGRRYISPPVSSRVCKPDHGTCNPVGRVNLDPFGM